MRKYRFYLENYKKDQNKVFIFDERVVNQAKKVLRMKKGDKISVFWGDGNDYELEIQEVAKDKISGTIVKSLDLRSPKSKKLILCPSLLKKPDRFEFLLEKATEIGAAKFIPIISHYSVKKSISKNQRERWGKIIIEAVEQSGGNFIPEIEKEIEFKEFLEKTKNISAEKVILSVVAGENQHILKIADKSAKEIYPHHQNFGVGVYLLFGPEGGWTEEELELAEKYGWKQASLGIKTLRAETAAIVASFVALSEF